MTNRAGWDVNSDKKDNSDIRKRLPEDAQQESLNLSVAIKGRTELSENML